MRLTWLWGGIAAYFLIFWLAVGDFGLAIACTAFFAFLALRYTL